MRLHPGWSSLYAKDSATGVRTVIAAVHSDPDAGEEYWIVARDRELVGVSPRDQRAWVELRSHAHIPGAAPKGLAHAAAIANQLAAAALPLPPGEYTVYGHRYRATNVQVVDWSGADDADAMPHAFVGLNDGAPMKWASHDPAEKGCAVVEVQKRVRSLNPDKALSYAWIPIGWAMCRGDMELRLTTDAVYANTPRSGDATRGDGPTLRLCAWDSASLFGHGELIAEVFEGAQPKAVEWRLEEHEISTLDCTIEPRTQSSTQPQQQTGRRP